MILSFDVWNTLLSANPQFKVERIQEIMRISCLPKIAVEIKMRDTKRILDYIQESTGNAFSSLFCWKLFLKHSGYTGDVDAMAESLLDTSNYLFAKHPPIFNVELVKQIRKMRKSEMMGITDIVLVSNTNFVPGKVLWEICFEHLDLFDKAYFSDQGGYGKPSMQAYAMGWPDVRGKKIFHIGDTLATDGAAKEFGAEFILVKDPEDTLKQLTEFTV